MALLLVANSLHALHAWRSPSAYLAGARRTNFWVWLASAVAILALHLEQWVAGENPEAAIAGMTFLAMFALTHDDPVPTYALRMGGVFAVIAAGALLLPAHPSAANGLALRLRDVAIFGCVWAGSCVVAMGHCKMVAGAGANAALAARTASARQRRVSAADSASSDLGTAPAADAEHQSAERAEGGVAGAGAGRRRSLAGSCSGMRPVVAVPVSAPAPGLGAASSWLAGAGPQRHEAGAEAGPTHRRRLAVEMEGAGPSTARPLLTLPGGVPAQAQAAASDGSPLASPRGPAALLPLPWSTHGAAAEAPAPASAAAERRPSAPAGITAPWAKSASSPVAAAAAASAVLAAAGPVPSSAVRAGAAPLAPAPAPAAAAAVVVHGVAAARRDAAASDADFRFRDSMFGITYSLLHALDLNNLLRARGPAGQPLRATWVAAATLYSSVLVAGVFYAWAAWRHKRWTSAHRGVIWSVRLAVLHPIRATLYMLAGMEVRRAVVSLPRRSCLHSRIARPLACARPVLPFHALPCRASLGVHGMPLQGGCCQCRSRCRAAVRKQPA